MKTTPSLWFVAFLTAFLSGCSTGTGTTIPERAGLVDVTVHAIEIPIYIPRDRTVPVSLMVRGEIENSSSETIEIERISVDQLRMLPVRIGASSKVIREKLEPQSRLRFAVPVDAYVTSSGEDFPVTEVQVRGYVFVTGRGGEPFLARVRVRL